MVRGSFSGVSAFIRSAFGLGLAITGALLLAAWLGAPVLLRLEGALLDWQFRLRGEREVGRDVVIVAIDERSLKEVGRWPWPREIQARLIGRIAEGRPAVIALDIIYAEPETEAPVRRTATFSHHDAADAVQTLPPIAVVRQADPDHALARVLRQTDGVVLGLPLLVPDVRGRLPSALVGNVLPREVRKSEFMLVRGLSGALGLEPHRATAAVPLLQEFATAAAGIGHFYSLPDEDGVTRWEYTALAYDDTYYPSFALEAARVFLKVPRERVVLALGQGIHLGDVFIHTDQKARMPINHAGPERTFPYLSATDVLLGRVSPSVFAEKLVLVGTTGLGTYDQAVTPFSANFPSMEKNATVVENILNQQFLRKSLWMDPLELLCIVMFGFTLSYGLPRLQALQGVLCAGGVLLAYIGLAHYLFSKQGVWIPLASPVLTILVVFVPLTVLNVVTRERQARTIRAMFSQYVNPRIVEELVQSPEKARVGGERKELTMLFADLIDFTQFSEQRPAEEVVAQLNEYLEAMTEVIFHWNGTLDKFVGDEIVVFWGAPLDQPAHAELAIKCALHMHQRLRQLQERWEREGKVRLDNGISINTGTALVGNIGAEGRKMDYTVIGDQVNLASRFQRLSRKFGCPIVITEHTARRLKTLMDVEDQADNRGRIGHVCLRQLGTVLMKGSGRAVGAYAVESLGRGEASRIEEQKSDISIQLPDK